MAKYSRKELATLILSQDTERKRLEAVKSVAGYLVSSGRSKELNSLVKEIELVAQELSGHVTAHVTSAHPLSDTQVSQIKNSLRNITNKQHVEVSSSIDTSLLGGVVINTPETEADLSVKGRLARMKG